MEAVKVLDEKYELVREIKRGGFGVVYYGRDRLFGKPVAIKAISPDLLGEAKYIDMFQAESLSVARLNHHNIVRLYDIKRTADGQFYIIMEYIDGVDLGKLIGAHRKRMIEVPFHIGAYIIAQSCAGLDYAHARRDPETHQPLNIVHQDISPGNIMINRLGEVKIIDFGLAGARRRSIAQRGRKREVLLQGKLAYIAPEQLNGNNRVDRRSDIFSLGLVLYEVLTGERLFHNEDPKKIIALLESGDWSFAELATKEVPKALQLIVQRAVQKHPENRYQTANQMYLDLMTYLATQDSGPDLSGELGLLVQRVAPMEKVEKEGRRDDTPTEALRHLYQQTHPENGVHSELAAPADLIVDIVDMEPVPGNEAVAKTEGPQQEGNKIKDHDEEHFHNLTFQASEFQATAEASEKVRSDSVPSEPPIQDVPYYRILEEEEEEEEIRTIIDILRLSTRSHKKAILMTLASLAAAFLLFTVIDTMMQWTSYGTALYNMLFPPAIRIVSFPPNAQVSLDDKLLPQTTPLAINKISPGVHKLMLSLPRFDPIIRSIQVPPKGKVTIQGETMRTADQPYVFRFKTILELFSKPSGAEVYLNGIKYTQPTPCRVVWEVGNPLQIEMEKPGLTRLAGFTFNSLEGVESIEDRRLWRFQRIEQDREHFAVEGTFVKAITLSSTPTNAEIYLDGSDRPVGVTGFTNRLLLTIGTHTVKLQKRGYLPKSFTLQLDENSPEQYHETLARVVKIFATDAASSSDSDINAHVVQLTYENNSTRVRATTPCELTLLPFKYTVLLRKDGYKDLVLTIPSASSVAVARMERIHVAVEILTVDEATGEPVQNVRISYRSLSADAREVIVGDTDETGVSIKELAPGEYRFTAQKAEYREITKEFLVIPNGKNRVVFKMQPQ
ncbi:MAG: protein kinase [candidate division KSB1 bacterium]|nr:protein kinase [candidate division KSB1 bacterium]MDZ7302701.1 protein kinase [candidate division KSB1 bacterium]MDZ7311768.1 protein kinase [candidate division KSB1 bacterium]